jgi:hypothetical protein
MLRSSLGRNGSSCTLPGAAGNQYILLIYSDTDHSCNSPPFPEYLIGNLLAAQNGTCSFSYPYRITGSMAIPSEYLPPFYKQCIIGHQSGTDINCINPIDGFFGSGYRLEIFTFGNYRTGYSVIFFIGEWP